MRCLPRGQCVSLQCSSPSKRGPDGKSRVAINPDRAAGKPKKRVSKWPSRLTHKTGMCSIDTVRHLLGGNCRANSFRAVSLTFTNYLANPFQFPFEQRSFLHNSRTAQDAIHIIIYAFCHWLFVEQMVVRGNLQPLEVPLYASSS